jgi:hypothetical protein
MKLHENDIAVQKQILNLIYRRLPNKKSKTQEQRKMLLDCMASRGYIIEPEYQPDEHVPVEPDEYLQTQPRLDDDFVQSYAESQQSSVSKYHRTFIEPGVGNSRLYDVQKYAITQDEQDYNNLSEKYDTVLNQIMVKRHDLPFREIKERAMEMYLEIKRVYRETNTFKGEMKGAIKQGYTLLFLYYALIDYKICISKNDLANFFNINLSDLPKADKNIKMVFKEPAIHELCLCGMRQLFDLQTVQKIELVINQLKERDIFNSPALVTQVAAAIHYVTKRTLKEISGYSNVTPDTIRKTVLVIENNI